MTTAEQLEAVVARWGPWNAHNIEVSPGLFTRPESEGEPNPRLRQVLQLVMDIMGASDLSGVRVADLGCLEGVFAIELALHGASAFGLEGRESNVSRARFAAEALGLGDRCTFVEDDVRNLSRERHGVFDVVLCLGLLYHLDARSVFDVLQSIHGCTTRALILDTHVSLRGGTTFRMGERTYGGHLYREHRAGESAARVRAREWASLDNLESFWPTRGSLYDALADVGFTSVLECHLPQSTVARADRVQLVALKGEPAAIRTVTRPATALPRYSASRDLGGRQAIRDVIDATAQLGAVARRRLAALRRPSD